MERCDWCDKEYEDSDWIENGESGCEVCMVQFCSEECVEQHNQNTTHPPIEPA